MKLKITQFTLIELLIVIAISCAVLGLTLPNLIVKPPGILKKDTIVKIETSFKRARLMAMASGTTSELVVDIDKNLIAVAPVQGEEDYSRLLQNLQNPELEELDTTPTKYKPAIFKEVHEKMPNGVSFDADDEALTENLATSTSIARFHFYADGEASGPQVFVNMGTQKYTLKVDRLTGRPVILSIED